MKYYRLFIGYRGTIVFEHTARIGSRQQLAGRRTARVPEAFWRCPADLWGPSTPNPAWVAGKTLILKIGRFSLYACGNRVDLPHVAKHAFGDQMGPNTQKASFGKKTCRLAIPLITGQKIVTFQKYRFFFNLLTSYWSKGGVLCQKTVFSGVLDALLNMALFL